MHVPTGGVTVVLGSGLVRRRVMALLDDASGRGPDGRAAVVRRVCPPADDAAGDPLIARLAALDAASGAALVLVDRLTDGLDHARRRRVLDAVRRLAGPATAVLVDDADAVAALAVADNTLRIDAERGAVVDPVTDALDYRAS